MSPANFRPLFLPGALLQAEDLSLQQEYQLDQDRTANRTLHTWGISEGLEPSAAGTNLVSVSAGMALDSLGRQLVLAAPVLVDLQPVAEQDVYITLRYEEELVAPTGNTRGTWFQRARSAARVQALAHPPRDASLELLLGRVSLSMFREVVSLQLEGRRYSGLRVGTLAFTNPTTEPARLFAGPDAGALRVEAPQVNLLGSAAIQGSVGVGMAVPGAALDIVGTAQREGRGRVVLKADPSPGGVGGTPASRHTAFGSGTAFSAELRVGDTLHFGGVRAVIEDIQGANVLTLGRPSGGDMPTEETSFQVQPRLLARIAQGNGQPVLVVTGEGRVGVGTEEPAAALHVAHGDVRLDGGSAVLFTGSGQVRSGDAGTHAIQFDAAGALRLQETGDILLTAGAPDGTREPTLTVSGAKGFVGVGTRAPVDALTVNGVLHATDGLIFPDGTKQDEAVVPIPIGTIVDWWRPASSFQVSAEGFQICDGSTVTNPSSPLRGTRLPDLRDQFVRSVSSFEEIGTTGGAETHVHDVVLQPHTHPIPHTHDIQAQFDTTPQTSGTVLTQSDLARADHLHELVNAQTLPPTPGNSSEYPGGDSVKTLKGSVIPPYMYLMKLMRII